jgi:uncharacterized repeat protein (TIGR03843 family)
MSANQRPPTTNDLSGWSPDVGPGLSAVLDQLTSAELTVQGRLPFSSNLTFLVSVKGGTLNAVYKPVQGERPLWDFPGGLHRRELAAYALSEALGWGLVPPTVARVDGPFGEGSLQLFVAADYAHHYFTLCELGEFNDGLRALCAFDVLANNADRKSGHVLLGTGGRLWGIDHGLCFHESPKLRTVMWDYAGETVSSALMTDIDRLSESLPDTLTRWLTEDECRGLVDRMRSLISHQVYPEPVGEHPPYPWPLV